MATGQMLSLTTFMSIYKNSDKQMGGAGGVSPVGQIATWNPTKM